MSVNKKRERGANYTSEEKALLIELIMQYKRIIEDKSTGGVIINKKKDAWKEITLKYNSNCTTGSRQTEQLKALYDNMKQKTRKSVGESNKKEYIQKQNAEMDVTEKDLARALKNVKEDKIQMHKTGGGFWKPKTTESDAKVLALIQNQIAPLVNPFDSGAVYFKDINLNHNDVLAPPMEVDIQLPNIEIMPAQDNIIELDYILESQAVLDSPKANYDDGDVCVSSPSILHYNAPMMAINTPVAVPRPVPAQNQPQHSRRKLILNTPSRKVHSGQKKFKNKEATIQKKVHKPKAAESYKRIYFKRKAENANLERKKLLTEILHQKQEHNLKMLILRKQLDSSNKC